MLRMPEDSERGQVTRAHPTHARPGPLPHPIHTLTLRRRPHCPAALEQRRAEQHPHLAGPEVRALCQVMHRFLGGHAAAAVGADGELLPRCDAELLRRHPFSPFATLPAVSAASLRVTAPGAAADAIAKALLPPSYVTPADWACGSSTPGAAAAKGLRDGLFLQVRERAVAPSQCLPEGVPIIPSNTAPLLHLQQPIEAASSGLSHVSQAYLRPSQQYAVSMSNAGRHADPSAAALPPPIAALLARLPALDSTLPRWPGIGAREILEQAS